MAEADAENAHICSPHELALQSLCKQLLKARLFRGFYRERRYVDAVNGYRDIVLLQRTERELEKVLLDIQKKLTIFYNQIRSMWIGITHGSLHGELPQPDALKTHIWTELSEVAFGQYWFSIKNIRFRNNEIYLKLKLVRPVEPESSFTLRSTSKEIRSRLSLNETTDTSNVTTTINTETITATGEPETKCEQSTPDIGLQDFIDIVHNWGTSIKLNAYEFLSKDVTKENFKELFKFTALLLVSIVSGTFVAVKYFGVFVLRFMFEFSRFTHTISPVLIKTIEVIQKVIAGFYLLLAMIWRDATNRRQPVPAQLPQYQRHYRSLTYRIQNPGDTKYQETKKTY